MACVFCLKFLITCHSPFKVELCTVHLNQHRPVTSFFLVVSEKTKACFGKMYQFQPWIEELPMTILNSVCQIDLTNIYCVVILSYLDFCVHPDDRCK